MIIDPYLQEVTASEPLSLEEEYDMQAQWCADPHKCTFLIQQYGDSWTEEVKYPYDLIGDVNLFMHDSYDRTNAEIELMVAMANCRRKGVGVAALCAMMRYGLEHLGITRFFAKISDTNIPSIELFKKYVVCVCVLLCDMM